MPLDPQATVPPSTKLHFLWSYLHAVTGTAPAGTIPGDPKISYLNIFIVNINYSILIRSYGIKIKIREINKVKKIFPTDFRSANTHQCCSNSLIWQREGSFNVNIYYLPILDHLLLDADFVAAGYHMFVQHVVKLPLKI